MTLTRIAVFAALSLMTVQGCSCKKEGGPLEKNFGEVGLLGGGLLRDSAATS